LRAPLSAGAENSVPCPLIVGTHKPPYEQLLVGMSFGALIIPRTPYTPREQSLTAVVGGAGCCQSPPPCCFTSLPSFHVPPLSFRLLLPPSLSCCLVSSPSPSCPSSGLFHLQSTPQAVAREAWGGWCAIMTWWHCCELLVPRDYNLGNKRNK
jgi:hypothetical protein